MKINTLTLSQQGYPEILTNIPGPPKKLFWTGVSLDKMLAKPRVAIVGSRRISPYGKQVTAQFAKELAEHGVVIISGLAFGVDALAHRTALDAGGLAIAVLPCSLNNIVPVSNRRLAYDILESGGTLVSEYAPGTPTLKHFFIARNRLMSGLADAVLITEAGQNSGTLHTYTFACEQGRPVMAVPGSIFNPGSDGANNILKSSAIPVTSPDDVLHVLGLQPAKNTKVIKGSNPKEQKILDLLQQGINEGHHILERSGLSVREFNQSLTMLEISGKIRPLGANQWAIC